MIIKLVRHGESESNVGAIDAQTVGDRHVGLTAAGKEQALQAGKLIGAAFFDKCLVYCSPYCRTRKTLAAILAGARVTPDCLTVYEDPRLREVEHGLADIDAQQSLRETHGWFYYRYQGGESPADCYDRTSSFLESLTRQVARKSPLHVLVVTHGLTARCFVMRFLHLTVEQYESFRNPGNCDIITLAPRDALNQPQFTSGKWGVEGLRFW